MCKPLLVLLITLLLGQFSRAAENELPVQETEQQETEQQDSELTVEQAAAQNSTEPGPGPGPEQEPEQEIVDDSGDLPGTEITQTNEVEEETADRFIPTEEISQDLGVSFPVDI